MSVLSGSNSQFIFEFPTGMIPDEINKKYMVYLERMPGNVFKDTLSFLNFCIQNVNLSIAPSYTPNEQLDRQTPYTGGRAYRESLDPESSFNKDLTIQFKLDSAYLVYFLLVDLWEYYYDTFKEKYLPNGFLFRILDAYGLELYAVDMQDVLLTGVDSINFDFSDKSIDPKTINATFRINYIDIRSLFDKGHDYKDPDVQYSTYNFK